MRRPTGAGAGARAVAGVTAYVVVAACGLAALLLTGTDRPAVLVLAALATAGLVAVLSHLLGRSASAVRRLSAETALIADANHSHRLDPGTSPELADLAAAVNRLADAREQAVSGAAEAAESSRRSVESERNRLAALMAQLTIAVVVCNSEGRILLYNDAARSLVDDASLLGLGRSVFGVVDRGLVAHAYDRLSSGTEHAYTATTLHRDRLLLVRVTLVREAVLAGEPGSGFVLVLEDLTRQVQAGHRRERLLRQLTEDTRRSLGSIRAAAESVLEFPEMSAAERRRFLEIVRHEADHLGRRVEESTARPPGLDDDRLLTDIAGDDVLTIVHRELERVGLAATEQPPPADLWVRADAHAVARAVVHVASRLEEVGRDTGRGLVLTTTERHAQLDLRWKGRPPRTSVVDHLLDEPLGGSGAATAREVADRHGAEIWCGALDADTAYLRVLLPLAESRAAAPAGPNAPPFPASAAEAGGAQAPSRRAETPSRPEFYDFDLFTGVQPGALADRRLDEVAYTVFDTETTGLDPDGGDRIVSIGAVRVVNGRVLRQETFERLVRPDRSVPVASTMIHGITPEMVAEQPTIDEVLPAFARFCEDTVLVGHNVSFDLRFLSLAGSSAGIELDQPALDTLLLHAALDAQHEDHTLEAIAARLGVSVVGRHTALGDALVTAEVFVALMALLDSRGIDTLGAALAASRRTFEARVDERLYRR